MNPILKMSAMVVTLFLPIISSAAGVMGITTTGIMSDFDSLDAGVVRLELANSHPSDKNKGTVEAGGGHITETDVENISNSVWSEYDYETASVPYFLYLMSHDDN